MLPSSVTKHCYGSPIGNINQLRPYGVHKVEFGVMFPAKAVTALMTLPQDLISETHSSRSSSHSTTHTGSSSSSVHSNMDQKSSSHIAVTVYNSMSHPQLLHKQQQQRQQHVQQQRQQQTPPGTQHQHMQLQRGVLLAAALPQQPLQADQAESQQQRKLQHNVLSSIHPLISKQQEPILGSPQPLSQQRQQQQQQAQQEPLAQVQGQPHDAAVSQLQGQQKQKRKYYKWKPDPEEQQQAAKKAKPKRRRQQQQRAPGESVTVVHQLVLQKYLPHRYAGHKQQKQHQDQDQDQQQHQQQQMMLDLNPQQGMQQQEVESDALQQHQQRRQQQRSMRRRHLVLYRGVCMYCNTRYRVDVNIPADCLPDGKPKVFTKLSYATAEQAARTADLVTLALFGPSAQAVLNFPLSSYSDAEVSDTAALLTSKYPGIVLGRPFRGRQVTQRKPALRRTKLRKEPEALAAAAKAAAAVKRKGLYTPQQAGPFKGVHERKAGEFVCEFRVGTGAGSAFCCLTGLTSALQAACAYDLARSAVYGAEFTVNFPPSAYKKLHMKVFRKHVETLAPDVFKIAAATQQQLLVPDYVTVEAGRALDRAVEEVVAAVSSSSSDSWGSRGVRERSKHPAKYRFVVMDRLCRLDQGRVLGFNRSYNSAAEAAAAADLVRIALDQPATNLPQHVTASQLYTAERLAAAADWVKKEAARRLGAPDNKQQQQQRRGQSSGRLKRVMKCSRGRKLKVDWGPFNNRNRRRIRRVRQYVAKGRPSMKDKDSAAGASDAGESAR